MAWTRSDSILKRGVDSLRDVFTFTAGAIPTTRFNFTPPKPAPPPQPLPTKSLKRQRSVHDIDGDVVRRDTGKKKRRLRLSFVTSRLSRPFSSPPTHIVDKGQSKIAVWAKQKAVGRILLRKAAILNNMRRQVLEAKKAIQQQRELEIARQSFLSVHAAPYETIIAASSSQTDPETRLQQANSPAQIPRRAHIPLPPSPLGLSNYDAFDLEDDIFRDNDEDGSSNDEDNDSSLIYSDFNILDHSEPVVDDHDSLEEVAPVEQQQAPKSPKLVCKRDAETRDEKERQRRLLWVPFVC